MREEWPTVQMGALTAQVRSREAPKAAQTYRFLGVRGKGMGPFLRDEIKGDTTKAVALTRVKAGQFIYNRLFAGSGSFGVIPRTLDGAWVSNEFPVFAVDPEAADARFLRLVFQLPTTWDRVAAECTGSTGSRMRWHERQFAAFAIALPPLAEQRRIVDLMMHVQRLRDRLDSAARATRKLGDSMRRDWFSDREASWQPIRNVIEITNGRLRNPANAHGPHMTRYIRTANVQDGRIDLDAPMFMNFTPKEQVRYALRPEDVLVTEGSGSRTSIGASCRWNAEIDGVVCFQNHLLRLRPINDSSLPASMVYQWALWSHRTGRFAEIATGTNILSLGVERVAAMPIPVVDSYEVAQFLALIEAVGAQEEAAATAAKSAAASYGALLSELLARGHEIPESYDRLLDGAP